MAYTSKGVAPAGSQRNTEYNRTYNSFSGVDMHVTFGGKLIGELEGLSFTVQRVPRTIRAPIQQCIGKHFPNSGKAKLQMQHANPELNAAPKNVAKCVETIGEVSMLWMDKKIAQTTNSLAGSENYSGKEKAPIV